MNGVCSVAACCGYFTAIERSEVLVFLCSFQRSHQTGSRFRFYAHTRHVKADEALYFVYV